MWLSTSHGRLYSFPWAAAFLMLRPTCYIISIEGIQTGLLSCTSFLSLRRTGVTKQSLTPGKAFDPALELMADDEPQMLSEKDILIVRAYTQVLYGKGICSPDPSDMGMYHRISLY
jgi:hypothetical protein